MKLKIDHNELPQGGYRFVCEVRAKRNGNWYDLLVIDRYLVTKNIESADPSDFLPRFRDLVMIHFLWWKPGARDKPSPNQEETIYEELENPHWQQRIKEERKKLKL